jgi:hypothetical protein
VTLERIIRPIVEGQIRSFLNDHPEVLIGVTRHKPWGKSQAEWVTDSLAKRIVRDLTCGTTTARLAAFLVEASPANADLVDGGTCTTAASGPGGTTNCPAHEATP